MRPPRLLFSPRPVPAFATGI